MKDQVFVTNSKKNLKIEGVELGLVSWKKK